MNGFKWQLYKLDKDWTQADSLPDKLPDMQQMFTLQASKYNVFPPDDRTLPRFMGTKPRLHDGPRPVLFADPWH